MNKYTHPCLLHDMGGTHTLDPEAVRVCSASVYPAHMSGVTISVYNCISSTVAVTQITMVPFPT